jgi:cytochrome P450
MQVNQSRRSDRTELYWDPFDEEIDVDPYPVWHRLQEEAPLYRNDIYDFWALSRYDDVLAASRDTDCLRSGYGTVLEFMTEEPLREPMMLMMDPPEHDRVRKLMSRAFTPARVAELEESVRALCADLLDPFVGTSGFDFVTEFAAIVPSMVIAQLLGVPVADREWVRETIDRRFHVEPGVGMVNDISARAHDDLAGYLGDLLEERRRDPKEDLYSALMQAELNEDGQTRRLEPAEAVRFGIELVAAGTETVARLLSWAAVILDENPEQRSLLAADPGLIRGGVEELLRYQAPSPVQARKLSRDMEYYGTVVPRDSRMLLLNGAAGRDPRRFEDPDRFDIRRSNSNLAFGFGTHFCIGAALARLEGRVALEETLVRFPSWAVDHERAVQLHTSTVRGYAMVPILLSS